MTIGRYAVYGEIAAGGMATVHFGRLLGEAGFSRPVAIKRLHAHLAKDPQFRAMFIDEARLVARIRHQNVIPTLDVVASETELFLVMEYVQGESLWYLMKEAHERKQQIPPHIAMAIASHVLHGLHAAHEATTETGEPLHIVHRDVSPQNVLVGTDGAARVLDFGIARAAVRMETTREGRIKGKLTYMAPEQLGGGQVTRKVDIYAAAVILWELLAGKRLFYKGDPQTVLIEKLFRGIPAKPSTLVKDVSPELDAIVLKAMARDPAERFETAREMAIALESCGKLATLSEVSAWVESLAHDSLLARSRRMADYESCSIAVAKDVISPSTAPVVMHSSDPAPAIDASAQDTTVASPFPRKPFRSLASLLEPELEPHLGRRLRNSLAGSERGRLALLAGVVGLCLLIAGGAGGLQAARWFTKEPPPIAPSPLPTVSATSSGLIPTAPCPRGMLPIPGGKFFMGSDDELPNEKPAHNVALSPYCIDAHEVTTEDYRTCTERGECKRAGTTNDWASISKEERKAFDPLCNIREPMARAKHPINCVDWEMASQYCRSRGARLPTEAEWEFAARSPDGRKYPWGDEEPTAKHLNACGKECVEWGKRNHVEEEAMFLADDGWATTAPVGSFPAGRSRYGVDDIVGNVWEWVSDYYAPYTPEMQTDPKGASSGKERVIRGGAWNGAYAAWVRPTFRYRDVPDKRSYGIGFRCAAMQGAYGVEK
jgi:serine/threonine-protein kinase